MILFNQLINLYLIFQPMALKRRKKRNPLTLTQIRCSMSTAIRELESIYMNTETEADLRIRAINSMASTVNAYTRLTEAHEFEERLKALEDNQLRKAS